MSAKARITSDFPTEQEVASRLRLSGGRVTELRRQLYDLYITHPDGSVTIVEIKKSRNAKTGRTGAKSSAVRSRSAGKKR